MTELQRYDQGGTVAAPMPASSAPTELDQWVLVVRDVSRLASQIADTPFVPDGMRGNPAAVTAAILTGREMGLGPMTSLQHIHIVKGKPGKSAEIMRGMVQAAGHSIRDIEANDTRVVLEGRRRDEETWTRVAFTADQAKRARIDLGGYPEDKLYARATTRLCRRKFADVVGGIALTVDELEDGDVPETTTAPVPAGSGTPGPNPAQGAKRTAKRRTAPKNTPVVTPSPEDPGHQKAAGDDRPAESPAPPELPDDKPSETDPATSDSAANDDDEPPAASREQLDKLHAQLGELGVTDRAAKLAAVGTLIQRQLATSTDLTGREASQAIDILAGVLDSDDPLRMLDAVLAEVED